MIVAVPWLKAPMRGPPPGHGGGKKTLGILEGDADPATVQPHPFLVLVLRQPSTQPVALSGAPVWSGGKGRGRGGSKHGGNGECGEDQGEDGDEKENDDGTEVRLILMPATVEDGESLVNMLSLPALSITPNELASSADADDYCLTMLTIDEHLVSTLYSLLCTKLVPPTNPDNPPPTYIRNRILLCSYCTVLYCKFYCTVPWVVPSFYVI